MGARICPNGHHYVKSSDCPVCPFCEADRKPKKGFLSLLSAPARRALEGARPFIQGRPKPQAMNRPVRTKLK
jgi:hypothetical protein